MPASSASLPLWVALPGGLLFIVGIVGLIWAAGWAMRLFNPTENSFKLPGTQEQFRFQLTKPGRYEISCTRPGLFQRYFEVPSTAFTVQALPDGPVQRVRGSGWGKKSRTGLDGATTMRITTFTAEAPGEFELHNPGAARFEPKDELRILPNTGWQTLGLILSFLLSGFATIGGLVVSVLALAGR